MKQNSKICRKFFFFWLDYILLRERSILRDVDRLILIIKLGGRVISCLIHCQNINLHHCKHLNSQTCILIISSLHQRCVFGSSEHTKCYLVTPIYN